jgi:hypothetical protein
VAGLRGASTTMATMEAAPTVTSMVKL